MNSIGQLYPVLLDATGTYIVDGVHRLKADPNWVKLKLSYIKTKRDIVVARIISNVCRREVSPHEKSEMFNALAEILAEEEKIPGGEVAKTICHLTGVSYRTVARYLSSKFKDRRQRVRALTKAKKMAACWAANINELKDITLYTPCVKNIKILALKKGGAQLVYCSKAAIKPGEEMRFHYHSSNFYWFCSSGEGICRLGSGTYRISPGTVIYCKKHIGHQMINTGNRDLVGLCFWHPPIELKTLILEDRAADVSQILSELELSS